MKIYACGSCLLVATLALAGCSPQQAETPADSTADTVAPAFVPEASSKLPQPGESHDAAAAQPPVVVPPVQTPPVSKALDTSDAFPEPSGDASWPGKSGLLKSLGNAISKGVSGAAEDTEAGAPQSP